MNIIKSTFGGVNRSVELYPLVLAENAMLTKLNLISLSTLDVEGYKYSGSDGILKVSKGSLVCIKDDLNSVKLYMLRGWVYFPIPCVYSHGTACPGVWIWHLPRRVAGDCRWCC
jgi:hypothetical protein